MKSRLRFRDLFRELFPYLYRERGNSHCPFHDDRFPSLELRDAKGICYGACASNGKGKSYDIFDIYQKRHGVDFNTAKRELAARTAAPERSDKSTQKRLVASYNYTNESGELLFQVLRYEPKEFRQRRPDENGGWIWNLKGTRRVLYNLPQIIGSSEETPIWFNEGEKATDALLGLGFTATCCPGGANKFEKLAREFSVHQPLKDRTVYIIPDCDIVGRQDAKTKAGILFGHA